MGSSSVSTTRFPERGPRRGTTADTLSASSIRSKPKRCYLLPRGILSPLKRLSAVDPPRRGPMCNPSGLMAACK